MGDVVGGSGAEMARSSPIGGPGLWGGACQQLHTISPLPALVHDNIPYQCSKFDV
jgi:hypothetical protein